MSRPKEFWIGNFKFGPDQPCSQNCLVSIIFGGAEWIDHVHVIEHSAYLKEKERADRLQADLEFAVGALVELNIPYSPYSPRVMPRLPDVIIREALAKIQGVKGE